MRHLTVDSMWGFIAAIALALIVITILFVVVVVKQLWLLIVIGLAAFATAKLVGSYRRRRDDTFGAPPQF